MTTLHLKSKRPRIDPGDRLFYAMVNVCMMLVFLVVLYPLLFVVSSSFSSPQAVLAGKVTLLPVDLSLEGFRTVFRNKDVFIGYYNSLRYMILGTFINVAMTMSAAYPFAMRKMPFKKTFTFIFTFTMFFGGGLIPNYILMKDIGLIDTIWVMVLPGAISIYNMIIARTFIQHSLPQELFEAASIDGCSEARMFFGIVLPLSKAVIAVIALYYAVGHWNEYFSAFIYLNSRWMYPLQLFLREILVANTADPSLMIDPELLVAQQGMADLLKYSLIVVASVPMMLIYPFAQKHFVKGVMIGSIKG